MPRTKQIKTGETPKTSVSSASKLPPREKALRADLAEQIENYRAKGWTINAEPGELYAEKRFADAAYTSKISNATSIRQLLEGVGMAELQQQSTNLINSGSFGNATDEVRSIELFRIIPSRFEPQAHRRKRFKDEDIEELGESIERQGLISPIVVRPVPVLSEITEEFEIVAGERRFLACQRKNLGSIKCFVRNISDEAALEIQMQENLQRVDIDPLDEAFSYKYYLEHTNHTIHDLAIRFGKPEKFIRQRLKLNDLIPEALEDIAAGHLPLGHAALMAKYSPELQKEILDDYLYEWEKEPYSFSEFKDAIESEVSLNLEKACFDTSAINLHPKGLSCIVCPERTGYEPTLFEEELKQGDSCLNKTCFESKVKRHFELTREEIAMRKASALPAGTYLDEAVKKVPLVAEYYVTETEEFPGEPVLRYQNFREAGSCDYLEEALCVDRENKGKAVFICRDKKCTVHNSTSCENSSSGEPSEWELKSRERAIWSEVARALQKETVAEAARNWIQDFETVEVDAQIIRSIILNYLTNVSGYNAELVRETLTDIRPFPKTFYQDNRLKNLEWIEALPQEDILKILFVISVSHEMNSYSYGEINLNFVRELARKSVINFDLLEADKLVEAVSVKDAPLEFREKALDYRLALINNENPKKPHFWFDFEAVEPDETEDFEGDDMEDEEDK